MLNPGDGFGDYKVIRLLGKGGMGAVYLLENDEGGQVAAKILDPATAGDHESRKRFLREAQLALGVKHPNLVETYDVGEDPDTGLCYILMEYVPGGSLADRLKTGPLSVNDAIRITYQIAAVLELARQKGIVHRDIKPDNIMFGADGKAKLADLGIARGGVGVTTVTQTGMMIGTPAYMAPEQMLDAHHVDTRADIYSLGIVFYEMLTGQRPNKDDTVVQLMAKAVAGEPIPDVRTMRPEVSASIAELIGLMCAMKANERIGTPAEVTTALSQIVHGREVTIVRKRPSAVARNPPKSGGDSSREVMMAVLGLFVAVGVAAFAYFGSRGNRTAVRTSSKRQTEVRSAHALVVARTNVIEKVVEKIVERTHVVTNVVGPVVSIAPADTNRLCTVPAAPPSDLPDRKEIRISAGRDPIRMQNDDRADQKVVNKPRQEKGPRYTEEGLLEESVFDETRFADRDSTRRVQKTLDALFPGWKTTKNAKKAVHPNEEIGYISDICGRCDVLATLPPSRQSPVRLTRSIVVPANAKLSFAVRKNPTAGGGLMLEVYANGKRRWEGVVTDDEWLEHAVDLSDLAGKKTRLEVRHMIHPDFGNARALWSDLAVR